MAKTTNAAAATKEAAHRTRMRRPGHELSPEIH
jgi:hypothetical protein